MFVYATAGAGGEPRARRTPRMCASNYSPLTPDYTQCDAQRASLAHNLSSKCGTRSARCAHVHTCALAARTATRAPHVRVARGARRALCMAIDQSCGCAVLRGAPPRCCSAMMAFLSPPIPARARATRCAPRCAVDPPAHAADPPPSDAVARNNARAQLFRHLDELQNNLSLAVKRERFADAARLRDQIHSLRLSDEYCRTEIALSNAVDEQRFGDAARLRDVLNTLDPPPVSAAERKQARATRENAEQLSSDVARLTREQAPASSVTRTHSICVRAESYYLPEQSAPEHNRYLFGYKITISNESKHVCQLVSRHWIIGSAGNADSHVKGAGVVGRQPVLMPGESFEYTSACPISSSLQPSQCVVGSMRGHFLFCRGDTGDIRFMVNIDPFYMQLPFHHFKMSS